MGSHETLLLALAIASAFPFRFTTGATETAFDADSWDMVAAFGNEIHFFKNDTEIRKLTVANISQITALAYDSVNRTLYISDLSNIRSYVVEENLDSELTFDRILHTSDGAIWSMVFDPVTKTLFWGRVGALNKMEVASYGIDSSPNISKLGFIYWTNHGDQGSIIERSRLDGTDREEILTIDRALSFYGLTVDHYGRKLYFGTSGKYFRHDIKIEETNLDGTDRRVIVNTRDSDVAVPSRLAVDDAAVYWADRTLRNTIWKVYKNGTAIKEMKKFNLQAYLQVPSNILTRHDVEGIDCKAVLDEEQMRTPEQLPAYNQSQVAARLEQLSEKMDRLLTNQNQLLLALIGLLDDARFTHTAGISRIDALQSNLLDKVRHPENLLVASP